MRIELTYLAWEASVLPLNYTRLFVVLGTVLTPIPDMSLITILEVSPITITTTNRQNKRDTSKFNFRDTSGFSSRTVPKNLLSS